MKRILLVASLVAVLAGMAVAIPSGGLLVGNATPVNGTNEVQTMTFDNNITGGTFTLKFSGNSDKTSSIAWNATTNTILSNIQTALLKLSGVGTGGVVVTAGTISGGHGTVVVTFSGSKTAKRDVPLLAVATNALIGTTHTLTIAETTPGVVATGRDAKAGTLYVNSADGSMYFTDHDGPDVSWRKSVNAPTPTPTATATP